MQSKMPKPLLFILSFLTFACADNSQNREAETARMVKQQDALFKNIDSNWRFNASASNPTSQKLVSQWAQWRVFLSELNQKPQSSISAFRKKAVVLSQTAAALAIGIPATYDRPEIRSRIAVITTKINMLNLFMGLDDIQDGKVLQLISEINIELASLQQQFAEIDRRNAIPVEIGEAEMIRMLDTARAIPNK